MDATAVKAEIKNWEHEFRAQNGRSATIEDVKALPHVAEKYKLYKKLTKEVEKNKGKTKESQMEPSRTRPSHEGTSTNPFLTPVKAKRTPSPGPFVPVQDAPSPSARQNAAIVKARKRLRGESVSPSPVPRDKRRRANGLDPPAHDRHSQARSVSPPGHSIEEGDSFVDDSPVKAPAGGKAFTPLFEEAMPLSQPTHSKPGNLTTRGRTFSRAKTLPSNLFGSLPSASTSTGAEASRKRKLSKVVEQGKHENHDENPVSNRWDLLPPSPPPQYEDTGQYNTTGRGKGKGKARDAGQKKPKKAKLTAADEEDDREDDTTSSDGVEVKIVGWRSVPRSPQHQERHLTLTVDPELQQFHLRNRGLDTLGRSVSSSLEKFEVDLPEEMHRVLALSHHDIGREREEEDLVKGLMRGHRRAGGEVWAPGEIGGESEMGDEDIMRVAEEDDWEGEGVPWEVAEL